jgi:hypothetical protein
MTERLAFERKLAKSFDAVRAAPSATFAGTETAERVIRERRP